MKQRLALVCALGLCAAMISACPPPAPVTGPGSGTGDGAGGGGSSDDDDCPSAPEGITSSIDAVSRLGRAVREARANLMVRVARAMRPARGQAPGARAPIFATLHHPLLAFAEAALAAPKKARDADKAWLQRSIGHAYVELRSREPIALDGDLDRITLRLAGRQHAALLLTVRRGDSGYVYRISFAPFVMGDDVGLSKIHLALPDGSVARWGLSARNVQSLGGRPFVYGLMPALWDRHVRRALLRGDMARAVARYDVLKRCAADEAQTKALAALMARLPKGAPAATPPAKGADAPQKATPPAGGAGGAGAGAEEPGLALGAAPKHGGGAGAAGAGAGAGGTDGTRPSAALAQAVLARLQGAARAGLISATAWGELAAAAQTASDDDPRWVAFEQALSKTLRAALDGAPGAPHAAGGVSAAPSAAGDTLLADRIARAEIQLTPRYVDGARYDAGVIREMVARLRGGADWPTKGDGRVLALATTRLQRGWIHPGLPPQKYRHDLVDRSSAIWRARARAGDKKALVAVARALLERELRSPDAGAAHLAARGVVAIGPASRALALLLPVASASTHNAAPALAALAALRNNAQVETLARKTLAAKSTALRAAAAHVLAARGAARAQLAALLAGGDLDVARAVLAAQLERGDAAALRTARTWLGRADRRALVFAIARERPALAAWRRLRGALSSALAADGSDVAILGAGRALGNAAARALGALYENQAARRPAIMRVAAEKGLRALLERAVGAPSLEVRRLAVAGLSKLAKPPRAPLERALKDSDARVRLAAQVGLARLGASGSLLSLGAAARGSCAARELVLAVFSASLDRASRARLLADALDSHCRALGQHVWTLAVRYQRDDPTLWRAGLSHADRSVRVRAALTALGVKGPLVERAP